MTYEDVVAQLTGPGGPFEIETVPVQGRLMKNWKFRERSMREKVERAAGFGDATFMVQGERRISYGEFAKLVWGAPESFWHLPHWQWPDIMGSASVSK